MIHRIEEHLMHYSLAGFIWVRFAVHHFTQHWIHDLDLLFIFLFRSENCVKREAWVKHLQFYEWNRKRTTNKLNNRAVTTAVYCCCEAERSHSQKSKVQNVA